MIIDDAVGLDQLGELLDALIKEAGKRLSMILDYLRGHHSKSLTLNIRTNANNHPGRSGIYPWGRIPNVPLNIQASMGWFNGAQ